MRAHIQYTEHIPHVILTPAVTIMTSTYVAVHK